MESTAGFFHHLMPHLPTLLVGNVLGAAIGSVAIWLQRPRKGKAIPSAFWPFGLLVVGVFSFLAAHTWLVHEFGTLRVLGGIKLTPDAAQYLESSPSLTRVEVISAFNGWADPERVWTTASLTFARIVAATTLAAMIAGMIALGWRLPSFFRSLRKLLHGT